MSTLRKVRIADAWDKTQARAVNEHLDDTTGIINGGMRLQDQFAGVRLGVRFNTANAPPKVGPFSRPPRWVLCLGARTLTEPSSQIGGAAVSWTMEGVNVVVTSVSGLATSTDYTVDLWLMEG